MSSESYPISASRFALAIHDLPAENLYSKAQELENSIAHLERSNRTLQEYIDSIRSDSSLPEATRREGDNDCSEAIQENETVIERQKERIELLKREVERRGGMWHGEDSSEKVNGSKEEAINGRAAELAPSAGGRLTDEEIQQRMTDRLRDAGDSDEDNGMHL